MKPVSNLTKAQRDLLRETEAERMSALEEDDLIALHRRVRRARDKHVGRYRRGASARVPKKGSRGLAAPANRRDAERAEIFEDALARVSTRLGLLAEQAAETLRAERLAAARSPGKKARAARAAGLPGSSVAHAEPRGGEAVAAGAKRGGAKPETARLKKNASTLAAGARRQAKRDSR